MTASQVINKVKKIKPSILEDSALLSFLNTVEAKLRKIVNNEAEYIPIEFDDINSTELLLDIEYDEIYLYYLESQIDLHSNDIASYNNFTILYNNAVNEYSNIIKSRKQTSPSRKYNYKGAF